MKTVTWLMFCLGIVLFAFALGFDAGGAAVSKIERQRLPRQMAAPVTELSPEDEALWARLKPWARSLVQTEVQAELQSAADDIGRAGQGAMPNLFGADPSAGSVLGDQIVDFTKREIRGMTVSTALLVFRNYWWAVLMIGTALMTAAAWMTKREARTVLAGMAPPPPSVTNTFVIAATQVAIPVPVKSGS